MSETPRPAYTKDTTEELMELVDVFNVSEGGKNKIRGILDGEETVPDAGAFFRYYNERSKVPEFEENFADKLGAKHTLGVNSGTSALIAALVAAGVGPGDEVIVPGYTFFASVSAIVVAKGIPVIAEINETLTLDPEDFESKISDRTKAVIVVHMVGHPAEMDRINEIAAKHDVKVIEDVAQACGGIAANETKGARNWHLYWYWEHILEQKTVTTEGCPFLCPHVKKLPDYSPDMCPKTKDVMTRLGLIAIKPTDTSKFTADRAKAISGKLAETFD